MKKPLLTLLGLLICLVVSLPLLWAFSTSIKSPLEEVSYPPVWIPQEPTLDNYSEALFQFKLSKYLGNSLVVTLGSVALTLVLGAHAGYASARFSFPGKSGILLTILVGGMMPGVALLVPFYMIAARFRLLNSYWALMLIYVGWRLFNSVWLLESYFEQVPKGLEEAAMIDGCTRLKAFYRVVLPMTQPGLAASALLVFIAIWNDFLRAYALVTDSDRWVVQMGLFQFLTAFGIRWGPLMAGTIVAILPVTLLFILLKNRFISGLTRGAMKG